MNLKIGPRYLPLVVDLDGTLIQTDLLIEFFSRMLVLTLVEYLSWRQPH